VAARSDADDAPVERVLVITRIFDAPRSLVFKMWTDPDELVRWQGPRGFTTTIVAGDLRPGGAYRFHMRGPEGDHWVQGIFREIVQPQRLVFTHAWSDAQGKPTGPETVITVTFEEVDGKTRLTLRQEVFESPTARDLHRGGWTSSLDRLDEILATAR